VIHGPGAKIMFKILGGRRPTSTAKRSGSRISSAMNRSLCRAESWFRHVAGGRQHDLYRLMFLHSDSEEGWVTPTLTNRRDCRAASAAVSFKAWW